MTAAIPNTTEQAIALSQSANWADRCEAGAWLARHADVTQTHQAILGLLLDRRDTAVSQVTSLALLERNDRKGLLLFVLAWAEVDEDSLAELSWALFDSGIVNWAVSRPVFDELANDADEKTSAATKLLLLDVMARHR